MGPPPGRVVACHGPRPPRGPLRRRRRGGLLHGDRLAAATARVDARPPRLRPTWCRDPGPAERRAADAARLGDGDTTHLCALDADGLGVSLTQSNALDFGSHLSNPPRASSCTTAAWASHSLPATGRAGAPSTSRRTHCPPCWSPPTEGMLTHLVGAMGGDAQPQIISQLLARLSGGGPRPGRRRHRARLCLDAPAAGPFRLWWGDDLPSSSRRHAPDGWWSGLAAHGPSGAHIDAFDPVAVGCAQVSGRAATTPGGRAWSAAPTPDGHRGGAGREPRPHSVMPDVAAPG